MHVSGPRSLARDKEGERADLRRAASDVDSKIRAPFSSLTLSSTNYTAVLDTLTPETYILVLARSNIRASPPRALRRFFLLSLLTPPLHSQRPPLSSSTFASLDLISASWRRLGWASEDCVCVCEDCCLLLVVQYVSTCTLTLSDSRRSSREERAKSTKHW